VLLEDPIEKRDLFAQFHRCLPGAWGVAGSSNPFSTATGGLEYPPWKTDTGIFPLFTVCSTFPLSAPQRITTAILPSSRPVALRSTGFADEWPKVTSWRTQPAIPVRPSKAKSSTR